MGRTSLWIFLIGLLCYSTMGCSGAQTEDEDGREGIAQELDDERPTSPELFVGTSQDDECEGPNVDWRRIIIRQPGELRISVGIDTPENFSADLFLHDGFGRPIDRVRINNRDGFYAFKALPVDIGRYFFRIACTSGHSVYTVAAEFSPDRFDAEQPNKLYVFKATQKPKAHRPKRRRVKRSLKPKPCESSKPKTESASKPTPELKTKPTALKPARKPKPSSDDQVATKPEDQGDEVILPDVPAVTPPVYHPTVPQKPKMVKGIVVLVTESLGGPTKITIRDIGTEKNFKKGMVGTIALEDRQAEVNLFECLPKRCVGTIDATPKELEDYREVKFIVQKP